MSRFDLRRFANLKWRYAALLLFGVFAAGNWQLFTGHAFEKWDAYELGSPYYSLLADCIRAGRLLYWNPWLACGSPDFAVAGSGTFSPDLLLAAAITGSGGNAYVIYWMTVWLAGGMGILLLGRHLRSPAWGGLAVALGFVFSGFYTGQAEHINVIYSYSLLPFIIWRLDVAMLERRILPAAQAGALWGLSGLAGYPALTIFTIALIVAWALGRCLCAPQERCSYKHAFVSLSIIAAVGVIVLAPSYLSAAYEGRGYSDRSEPLERSFALTSNAFQPGALATLSSPALVEFAIEEFRHEHRTMWLGADLSGVNLYTGSITLLLALVALGAAKQGRWRWYLLAIALLALACAMSDTLPLRGWLYDFIPPTRYFRHSSMLRGYALFLFSVLALLGARDIAAWPADLQAMRRFLLLAPALAFVTSVVFAVVSTTATIEHPEPGLALTHTLVLQGGLILLAIALRRHLMRAAPLLPVLLVSFACFDGIAAVYFSQGTLFNKGTRPKFPFTDTSVALGPKKFTRAIGSARINANLILKVPTLKNYAPFRNRFHEIITADPALQTMALGKDRVWFAHDAPEVTPSREIFASFVRRWAELEAPIFLRHPREKMLVPTPATGADFSAVASTGAATAIDYTVLDYRPDNLALQVDAPSDGWLMVSDRWSRSWHATVNGIERPISGANFIFRAVPIVKGVNHIEFFFRPIGMPGTIILSWSVLGLIVALTIAKLPTPNFRLTSAAWFAPDLMPAVK